MATYKILVLFIAMLVGGSLPLPAMEMTTSDLLRQAEQAWTQADYEGVVASYEAILKESPVVTAQLYANLGKAYYELAAVGQAVWAYKMACRFAPRDEEGAADLLFIESQHVPPFSLGAWQQFKNHGAPWTAFLNSAELVITSAVFYIAVWILGIFFLITQSSAVKRLWVVSIALAGVWIGGTAPKLYREKIEQRGVLIDKNTPAYANFVSKQVVFTLSEGEELVIIREESFVGEGEPPVTEHWTYINTPRGERAWVKNAQVRPLY